MIFTKKNRSIKLITKNEITQVV